MCMISNNITFDALLFHSSINPSAGVTNLYETESYFKGAK